MRDHIERFLVLPFSFGCISQSSVALSTKRDEFENDKSISKKPSHTRRPAGEEKSYGRVKMQNSSGFFALTKPKVAGGIRRLIRGIKSFSQLFVYKEDNVDLESEMEIGYPTDVKHLTHIGLDGSTTTNPMKDWEDLKPPEVLPFSSLSLKQFELAMAAQARQQPLVLGTPNISPSNDGK